MMKLGLLYLVLMTLNCSTPQNSNKKDSIMTQNEAVGLWQIPKNKRRIDRANSSIHPGTHVFSFDGNHVTLFLITEKEWMWKTEDDFYKLQTKWEETTLYYLPPFGRWTPLATFDGQQFWVERADKDIIWHFNKIKPIHVDAIDQAILKQDRIAHDYSIKPMDVPDWRK